MVFSRALFFNLAFLLSGATPCVPDGRMADDTCSEIEAASSFLQTSKAAPRGSKDVRSKVAPDSQLADKKVQLQAKSDELVTTIGKFDCMANPTPIQVLKDGKTGFAFKELNVETGEYSTIFDVPFNRVFPAYKDLNSCGINPIDSIAYCTMWTKSNKNFVVRIDKDRVEFVAKVPVEKFFNTGTFSSDGTYYIADEKARFLIIENVHKYPGVRSERNPNLLDWGSMKAVKPKGFHSAYDAVVVKSKIEGTKKPKDYLIVLSKGSLLIARAEDGKFADETYNIPYMTGNKKDGWKKGKATDKWGAGWAFSGRIFFAANDGAGVYQVDLKELDLKKHGSGKGQEAFKMKLIGKSDKSGFNDGTNCLKGANPWVTTVIPVDCATFAEPMQALRQPWFGYVFKKLDIASGVYKDAFALPFDKTTPPYKFLNAIGVNPMDGIAYGCLLFRNFPSKFFVVRFDGRKFEYVAKVEAKYDPIAGAFNEDGDYFFVINKNTSHNPFMFQFPGTLHEMKGSKTPKGVKTSISADQIASMQLPLYNFFHFSDIVVVKMAIEDGKVLKDYIVSINRERQGVFVEWDKQNVSNSKISKFTANDPFNGTKMYHNFGAAWNYQNRPFFASNDGLGVVEITDVNTANNTIELTKVGDSTGIYNNDGFNCWDMKNPFPAKRILLPRK